MNQVVINNKKILFRNIRCPILKVNQRTETSFSASAYGGGGSMKGSVSGNIYNGSGGINGCLNGSFAPVGFTYSGGSVTYNEFWLKDENNTEFTIELLQSNIKAREGNDISVIYATVEGDENCFFPIVFINHSTKVSEILMNGTNFLYYKFNEDLFRRNSNQFPIIGVVGLGIGVYISMQTASYSPVVIISIVGFIVEWLVSKSNKDRVDSKNRIVINKRAEIDAIFSQEIRLAKGQ